MPCIFPVPFSFSTSLFAPIPAIFCGPPPLLHKYFLLGLEWHMYINCRIGCLSQKVWDYFFAWFPLTWTVYAQAAGMDVFHYPCTHPASHVLLFGEKGKGFFLNYFLTPWVRFPCSWWQCCSTVVKSSDSFWCKNKAGMSLPTSLPSCLLCTSSSTS